MNLPEDLLRRAEAIGPVITAHRRHLHQFPEAGPDLPNTVAYVREQLEALGVQEDQLPEFLENLQVFLSEEDVNSGKKPLRPLRDLIGLGCGMSGLLLVLAGGAFIGFRRFRQGKSR